MLGFIGAGRMGSAILSGVVEQNVFPPDEIIVSDPQPERLEDVGKLGVGVTSDNCSAVQQSDIIILAIKPQMFESVLSEIAPFCKGKCLVSIAAGISTEYILKRISGAVVIRVMPNTPLQVGYGMTAVASSKDASSELFETVCNIFRAAGSVVVVPENQMDEVVSLSGSSPAYFFRMADVMSKWAAERGMDVETAVQLVSSTMLGASEMLLKAGKTPEELTQQVCSPGGTTIAALSAFDDQGFDPLIQEALNRCADRSKELGQ
ncbi:MAG: pyrroline-5-carboxylate reductase [Oscillospiraceae bacterium]|nr:pyrroline-5-carboxylate reductase [Oscillospiraceae bacterium]